MNYNFKDLEHVEKQKREIQLKYYIKYIFF